MKTITKCESKHRRRGLLLSLLSAGVVATFMAGCADTGHVTAYDSSYYYPTGNYVRDYAGYTQSYPYSRNQRRGKVAKLFGQFTIVHSYLSFPENTSPGWPEERLTVSLIRLAISATHLSTAPRQCDCRARAFDHSMG